MRGVQIGKWTDLGGKELSKKQVSVAGIKRVWRVFIGNVLILDAQVEFFLKFILFLHCGYAFPGVGKIQPSCCCATVYPMGLGRLTITSMTPSVRGSATELCKTIFFPTEQLRLSSESSLLTVNGQTRNIITQFPV